MSGKHGFWANASGGRQVFVGLGDDVNPSKLQQGQHVMIAGKVLKAPGDASRIAADKWGLSSDDVKRLMQDKVFIRVDALRTVEAK